MIEPVGCRYRSPRTVDHQNDRLHFRVFFCLLEFFFQKGHLIHPSLEKGHSLFFLLVPNKTADRQEKNFRLRGRRFDFLLQQPFLLRIEIDRETSGKHQEDPREHDEPDHSIIAEASMVIHGLCRPPRLPVIGELQIDPKIIGFQQGDDRLELVARFPADPDTVSLDLGLNLYFGSLDFLHDLLRNVLR